MPKIKVTMNELQEIAKSIGCKISKEHPDIFNCSESEQFCETKAIEKMNEFIKKRRN